MQHCSTRMHTYTSPNSTQLNPRTDCCFMWLQLYSFQNILSYQFQQRPWPLVVWVHKEKEGEHICLLCLWSALWVYVSKHQHIESQKIRGQPQPTQSFLLPGHRRLLPSKTLMSLLCISMFPLNNWSYLFKRIPALIHFVYKASCFQGWRCLWWSYDLIYNVMLWYHIDLWEDVQNHNEKINSSNHYDVSFTFTRFTISTISMAAVYSEHGYLVFCVTATD